FAIPLDPGFYDVIVMPRDGTRLPWVVARTKRIETTDVTIERFVVPAPVHLAVALLAQTSALQGPFPVRGALVRAFATVAGSTVEIGRTTVGSDGTLEMFLAAPQ